ncbi:tyrosine-protein kinase, partial [Serratia marcescens]
MTENTEKKSISAKYNELNVEKIVGHLLDYRWLLIGVTALFAVFGILYSLFATPVYQADALVQVEKNAGGALLDNLSDIMPNSQPESNTEIEIIQSRLILGRAVDDLGLETEVQEKYFPI